MRYIGEGLYPVDQTFDGGDSAVRTGIDYMCGPGNGKLLDYWTEKGFVRHPKQVPWNNPKNFSRDQTMMLLPAFKACGQTNVIKKFFWQTIKRGFFAQNFERDHVGTTKYPWPHQVPRDGDGKLEWRYFDFADPLLPNHIGAIILAGRIKWAYVFLPISYPIHLLTLFFHSRNSHHEENQMIAECYLYGTLKVYKRIHPQWVNVSRAYWQRRNEIEYHDMLVKLVEGA